MQSPWIYPVTKCGPFLDFCLKDHSLKKHVWEWGNFVEHLAGAEGLCHHGSDMRMWMVSFIKGLPLLGPLRFGILEFSRSVLSGQLLSLLLIISPRRVVLNLVSVDFQGVLWGLGTSMGGNDIVLLASQ